MTPEGLEIAAMIECYPEWVRRKMVESTALVMEAYECTVMKTPLVRASAEALPANVVSLQAWKQSRTG